MYLEAITAHNRPIRPGARTAGSAPDGALSRAAAEQPMSTCSRAAPQMWSGGQEPESKTMPSSHSPTTTHVVSRPGTAEPRQALVQEARSQGSPGLVRRALFKFLGSAENLVIRTPAEGVGRDSRRLGLR